jgi:hypothetical protein
MLSLAQNERLKMSNVRWRMIGGYQVSVMNKSNPTKEEWDEMIQRLAPMIAELKGTVVYTLGGAPSATQRRHLRGLFDKQTPPPAAILTESVVAQTAITALNLFFGGAFRAFSPQALKEALLFVKVPSSDWELIRQALIELSRELGVSPPQGGFSLQ